MKADKHAPHPTTSQHAENTKRRTQTKSFQKIKRKEKKRLLDLKMLKEVRALYFVIAQF